MLRNRKSISGRCLSLMLTILSASGSGIATASDDVPAGYKVDRYQPVWDRNPFTLVTPVVQSVQPKVFDKLVLVSWLNDGGNDVVFVQNIETNEVQKITKDPNSNNFRLVTIHKAADPKDADAVLSDGNEEGSVKFRLEAVAAGPPQAGQTQAGQPQGGQPQGGQPQVIPAGGAPNQVPAIPTPPLPGPSRQAQAALKAQQASRVGAPQGAPAQAETPGLAPRASEVRRKRITAPPVTEQPVGIPTPAQTLPGQPQTQ
jgi:hypothetical protein